MANKFKNLKNDLREISVIDRIRARMHKYPSNIGDTCELYDQWVCEFLDSGVAVVKVDRHVMTLSSDDGRTAEFWIANYPYSYGNRCDVGVSDNHWGLFPRWDLVLRLRELQLISRQEIIDNYRYEMLIK